MSHPSSDSAYVTPVLHPGDYPTLENLETLFTCHPPSEAQKAKYQRIRAGAQEFGRVLLEECPACADRAAAVRLLREAVMTANAAVALETAGR